MNKVFVAACLTRLSQIVAELPTVGPSPRPCNNTWVNRATSGTVQLRILATAAVFLGAADLPGAQVSQATGSGATVSGSTVSGSTVSGSTVSGAKSRFPYTAYVVSRQTRLRSGPGQQYYTTETLKHGDTVQVYQHDPGGWYAIRPPEHAFSWVAAEYIDIRTDQIARVTANGVVVRVGSHFSPIRDVIQVKLDQGDQVELFDAQILPDGRRWYQIAPPPGEFRWIAAADISKTSPKKPLPRPINRSRKRAAEEKPAENFSPASLVREIPQPAEQPARSQKPAKLLIPKRPNFPERESVAADDRRLPTDRDPLIEQQPVGWQASDRQASDRQASDQSRPHAGSSAEHAQQHLTLAASEGSQSSSVVPASQSQVQAVDGWRPPDEFQVRRTGFVQAANSLSQDAWEKPPDQPNAAQAQREATPSTGRETNKLSPGQSPRTSPPPRSPGSGARVTAAKQQAVLDELHRDMTVLLARPRGSWDFDRLYLQAKELVLDGRSAKIRQQAQLLLEQIDRFESIRKRYQARQSQAKDQALSPQNKPSRLSEVSARSAARTPHQQRTVAAPGLQDARLDGYGRLAPVVSGNLGAPHFALLDELGHPRAYVTPSPGLNLLRHAGKQVGVIGTMTAGPDKVPHVFVRRVVVLHDPPSETWWR